MDLAPAFDVIRAAHSKVDFAPVVLAIEQVNADAGLHMFSQHVSRTRPKWAVHLSLRLSLVFAALELVTGNVDFAPVLAAVELNKTQVDFAPVIDEVRGAHTKVVFCPCAISAYLLICICLCAGQGQCRRCTCSSSNSAEQT